jgi:hypothetical protein
MHLLREQKTKKEIKTMTIDKLERLIKIVQLLNPYTRTQAIKLILIAKGE